MIRELRPEDTHLFADYTEVLNHLTDTPPLPVSELQALIARINRQDGHIFVYLSEERVVSAATILVEQKIIHGGCLSANIEEVATKKGCEGRGYATKVLAHMVAYARKRGCYKIVLHCKAGLESFYNKAGFQTRGLHMGVYFSGAAKIK